VRRWAGAGARGGEHHQVGAIVGGLQAEVVAFQERRVTAVPGMGAGFGGKGAP
jgi:hypothetical protein